MAHSGLCLKDGQNLPATANTDTPTTHQLISHNGLRLVHDPNVRLVKKATVKRNGFFNHVPFEKRNYVPVPVPLQIMERRSVPSSGKKERVPGTRSFFYVPYPSLETVQYLRSLDI